ncbi:hypothetical protein NPIL_440671 [Nephila pilipes]|uniref:Uncharacterized protein n=1 Tax=Nephila pilipes TaxID=299642 RepID=A0A8X6QD27_NEPPI|nr:hypothetical protein NPIL_440671 [Nephila pilipes]
MCHFVKHLHVAMQDSNNGFKTFPISTYIRCLTSSLSLLFQILVMTFNVRRDGTDARTTPGAFLPIGSAMDLLTAVMVRTKGIAGHDTYVYVTVLAQKFSALSLCLFFVLFTRQPGCLLLLPSSGSTIQNHSPGVPRDRFLHSPSGI